MALYFECRARYDKIMEDGSVKKVNEPYLVDALSFTEAEARFTESITLYISGEFEVTVAKKTKIAEIFNLGQSDRYYLVRCGFITLDEKTGVEKRTSTPILVCASGFDDAVLRFKDGMAGTMADYEIISVSETPYMDVFTFNNNNQ